MRIARVRNFTRLASTALEPSMGAALCYVPTAGGARLGPIHVERTEPMRTGHLLVLAGAATIGLGVTLGSPAALAGSTWHQAYQRADSSDGCPAPVDQTPWQPTFTGQEVWTASWAQWPNDGMRGWVCQRELTWARDPAIAPETPSGPGCVSWMNGFFGPYWYDFLGSTYLPAGAPIYGETTCTTAIGGPTLTGTAYASDATSALAICSIHGYSVVYDRTNGVWSCG